MAAPTLNTHFSPAFPNVMESAANPDGVSIATLLPDGTIADGDGVIKAIAITALDTSLGAWQYSLDGGANWLVIDAERINSASNEMALLLGASAKLRLLPFGDLNGFLAEAITFRAWDTSDGLPSGSYKVIAANGGNTAFSTGTATASLMVIPVNDAPTFQKGQGFVFNWVGPGDDYGQSLALQSDGKMVVAGYVRNHNGHNNFAVIRLNTDGSIDTKFGSAGKVIVPVGDVSHGYSVVIQPDGKILVSGQIWDGNNEDFGVIRLNTDGSLDASFSGDGKVVIPVGDSIDFGRNIVLQPDGKILVAGSIAVGSTYDPGVIRLNTDGSMDASFAGDGKAIISLGIGINYFGGMAIQEDGKVLLASSGLSLAVIRLNSNGSLDTTFADGGKAILSSLSAESLSIQKDGKILIAGYAYNELNTHEFSVMRLNPNGSLDTGFGSGGKAIISVTGEHSVAHSIALQADGKILLAGKSWQDLDSGGHYSLTVVRLNVDGSLDASFGAGGKMVMQLVDESNGYSIMLQPDGKILVAGHGPVSLTSTGVDFLVARLNADGSLDTSFNQDSYSTLGDQSRGPLGSSVVALDTHVEIYDPELAALADGVGNYSGTSVSLARAGGANAEDVFSALGNMVFNAGSAVLSGVTVGTVDNGGGELTITFNSNATQARVNEVLSSIGYFNSATESPGTVEIDWIFSDGNNGSQGVGGALATLGRTGVGENWVDDPGILWVSGVALQGQTLRAILVDSDYPEPVIYQWFRNALPIQGATGTTYILSADDVGEAISVRASNILNGDGDLALLATSEAKVVVASNTETNGDFTYVYGTAGPDHLNGSEGRNVIYGSGGNDYIHGGPLDDYIDGGEGDGDVLQVYHLPSQYNYRDGQLIGVEGTDTLVGIEYIGFGFNLSDTRLHVLVRPEDLVDPEGAASSHATDLLKGICDLFIAFFDRAPRPEGLLYWFKEIYHGGSGLHDLSRYFADQAEYLETYPEGFSNRQFVETVFENLFDRKPAQAGWDYWENTLNQGLLSRDTFIFNVIEGAYAPSGGVQDKLLLNNKHQISLYYVEQLSLHSDEQFDSSITAILNSVTTETYTTTVAREIIDHAMENTVTITDIVENPALWDAFWAL